MKKNILSILDVKEEINELLNLAIELKKDYKSGKDIRYLKGKRLAMIFERTSVRTRVSFEFGIQMLGGIAISLTKEDIGIGTRETVEDIALAMSRYADIVMYRALDKKDLHEFATHATIPVINGLDIDEHPTQILADLTTMKEKKHSLNGLKFVFIGDGDDNLTHSYMLGCPLVGMNVTVITKKSHWPSKYFLEKATDIAKERNVTLTITEDLNEIQNADVVATDTWVSIWYKDQRDQILQDLKGYTVTPELMKKAKPDAIFIHCMPIFYGEGVTREVAHGPQSVIIDEAENRMWAEMALMVKLLRREK